MKITLLQQDIAWANPEENQRRSEVAILAAPHSDLYVLPEMWSTGFMASSNSSGGEHNDALLSENSSTREEISLMWMKQMAARMDAAIAGSLAVKAEDGSNRNRFYFVMPPTYDYPDGKVEYYDKRHLFTYGKEHMHYSAGEERKVVEWRGVKFLLQVCYDLRFPCFSRNIINKEGEYLYDCALYVASWPESRIKPWKILLQARAIENQCYVAGVDRVGDDSQCHYCGGTELVDAYGRIVEECPEERISSITCELDMEKLTSFRAKFPVLKDAD